MKFKIGDRVAVYYDGATKYIGEVFNAFIINKEPIMLVAVDPDGVGISVHEKQCRRLVKKVRRRVFIKQNSAGLLCGTWCDVRREKTTYGDLEDIEFVECKKK